MSAQASLSDPSFPQNDPRELTGWYFYDWANSAFYTTVVTVLAGPYLTEVAKAAADAEGFIYPFGIRVAAGSLYGYVVSLSVGFQVVFLPLLGAVADYSHRKKQMLGLFAYLGACSTLALYFLSGDRYLYGASFFILANLSFGAAIVFYNSFLPEIATPDRRDSVSSKGWGIGYVGGGVLLALNLGLLSQAERWGLSTAQAVRICLASAGLWWAVFTVIPLLRLRNRVPVKKLERSEHLLNIGFRQLRHTLADIRHYPHTLLFLAAYLFYNDGIQTVIALSAQFGNQELNIPVDTLTLVILMVQFVAFGGALLFNVLASRIGAKRSILLSLVIWTGTLIYIYGYLRTTLQFFIVAAVLGIVLGGSQALSRSVFSLMIPKGKEAEYFSLYEVSERGTSWMGPFLFALAYQLTGNYRIAILSLIIFFFVGLAVLVRVDVRRAALESGNEPPPLV